MIQVRELSKFYGKKAVVEEVNVNIHRGKITSFIGPNGAGKSTLLSMVSRLLDADTGEVLVDKDNTKKMKSNDFSQTGIDFETVELYECPVDDPRTRFLRSISAFQRSTNC